MQYDYDISAFNSLGPDAHVNHRILQQECRTAGLDIQATAQIPGTDDIRFQFLAALSAGEIAALDSIVDDHVGGLFGSINQGAMTGHEPVEASDSTEVQAVALITGPMEEGDYMLIWYGEVAMNDENDGGRAVGRLNIGMNGAVPTQRAGHNNDSTGGTNMGGMTIVQFKDGDSAELRLTIAREAKPGGSPSSSKAQLCCAQVFLRKA